MSQDTQLSEKKLRRSSKGAIIGGVCAGLGKYFDLDPWVFRIIFLLLSGAGGGGFLVYIILWMFVPNENSKLDSNFSCARVLALLGIVITAIVAIVFVLTLIESATN